MHLYRPIYKVASSISQTRRCVSISKTSLLMLYKESDAVYCRNYKGNIK
jgi:hypothetical protein